MHSEWAAAVHAALAHRFQAQEYDPWGNLQKKKPPVHFEPAAFTIHGLISPGLHKPLGVLKIQVGILMADVAAVAYARAAGF